MTVGGVDLLYLLRQDAVIAAMTFLPLVARADLAVGVATLAVFP